MEVTLKGKRPTLTVNAGDETFHVPLTFNRVEFERLGKVEDKFAAVGEFFAKYLGDVYDELGDDDLSTLLDAWLAARKEIGAPDMGEPSASPQL